MSTKVRNIHATENRRIRLIPKNGAVGTPAVGSEEAVAEGVDGSLSFCLTPAIMCAATETVFRALASSGATFDTAEGVALAARYVISPMGPGDAYSENVVRVSSVSFFDPNEVVERIFPNMQFNIQNTKTANYDYTTDWKTVADDLGYIVSGMSSPMPMEQSEGWVIEVGTHEHFGLPLPNNCLDYFTLCGFTEPFMVVSCPDGGLVILPPQT